MDFKQLNGILNLVQLTSTPASPPKSGYLYIYPKSDGLLYAQDSSGSEGLIGGAGLINYLTNQMNKQAMIIKKLIESQYVLGEIQDPELINYLNC
jgi:hypothetical protein